MKADLTAPIIEIVRNIEGLACAFHHGSSLNGYLRPDSDVDIALLFFPEKTLGWMELQGYAIEAEKRLGYPIHFSVLSTRDLVFAKEVIATGKEIFCADAFYCGSFAMHVLSMYTWLNFERREVLKQYGAG